MSGDQLRSRRRVPRGGRSRTRYGITITSLGSFVMIEEEDGSISVVNGRQWQDDDADYEPTEASEESESVAQAFAAPVLPERMLVNKTMLADDRVCAVCIDPFRSRQHVRVLGCGHVFHVGCIDPWARRNESCPSCRRSMREAAAAVKRPRRSMRLAAAGAG